jgi:DNA polymerase III subunit delta
MPSTPEVVLEDLKRNKYAPVYFLQGEEPFFIDQIADYIEANALKEGEKSFNQVVMYGKESSVAAVLSNAKRFPMMADRQVVIVKEAQDMGDLEKELPKIGNPLVSYLKNPVASTILVFCHKYKNLDARKSLYKEMDKSGIVVTTKKLYENKLPDWINSYVKSLGLSINSRASSLLADSVGVDLSRIAKELEKVRINLKDKKEIDENDIQQYVGLSKEYNPFELCNALKDKNILKANQIIHYFGSDPKSNPAIQVISVLYNFFSKTLQAHYSPQKDEASLASLLKVNPYFVRDYTTAMRVYPPQKTMDIIHYLKEADMQSKGVGVSNMDESEILKELVFKILH